MTDYNEVPLIYTGDWIDAAWLNQYLRDNFRAFKQGFAVAGDMPYALDGNTIAALAKPAGLGLLQNDAAGVPSYFMGGSARNVLQKNAANDAYEWGAFGYVCAVERTTNQTLGAGVVSITMPTEVADVHGWHHPSVNTDRITPTIAGTYLVIGYAQILDIGGSGFYVYQAAISKNGAEVVADRTFADQSAFEKKLTLSTVLKLNGSTDYVTLSAEQNTGDSLNVRGKLAVFLLNFD